MRRWRGSNWQLLVAAVGFLMALSRLGGCMDGSSDDVSTWYLHTAIHGQFFPPLLGDQIADMVYSAMAIWSTVPP